MIQKDPVQTKRVVNPHQRIHCVGLNSVHTCHTSLYSYSSFSIVGLHYLHTRGLKMK